jgi:hypothetical protein
MYVRVMVDGVNVFTLGMWLLARDASGSAIVQGPGSSS